VLSLFGHAMIHALLFLMKRACVFIKIFYRYVALLNDVAQGRSARLGSNMLHGAIR
jgi:hypothetical protein